MSSVGYRRRPRYLRPVGREEPNRSFPKRRRRLKFTPRFMVFVLCVSLVVCIGTVYVNEFLKVVSLKRDLSRIQARIADLRAKNKELREQVERMQTDEYIEEAARTELGMIAPGEEMYLIKELR